MSMNHRSRISARTLVGAVGLSVVAMCTNVAPAAADDAIRRAELRSATVAYGPACAGQVFAQMTSARVIFPGPDRPAQDNRGRVYVSVGGTFVGISDRLGAACRVDAGVRWRNLRTGASGVVSGMVSGTMIPAASFDVVGATPRTGSGPVEFTLTTSRPHIVERTVLHVH